MKNLLTTTIICAALAFTGCNNNGKDSKELADSLNETKDTTSNTTATGGIAVADDDAEFAVEAAVGGMAEVEFSKLAQSKSTNSEIKAFADMMVSDHGKANEKLKEIASSKNITLPTQLDEEHQKKYNELDAKNGKDFDKAYVDAMVDGHQKTLDMLKDERKDAKDQSLKAFADETIPTVDGHLKTIKAIKDKMK